MSNPYFSIQENLGHLSTRWSDYSKNERQGYQTFLSEFFACFGIKFLPNELPFEHNTGKGFADCYIQDTVIFEMKDKTRVSTVEQLLESLPQALGYWEGKGKHVPYLVLCNFSHFVIHDTRDGSNHAFKLAELENRVESFNFLIKLNPTFVPEQEEVTRKSARVMGDLYQSLKSRLKDREDEVDLFVLQCTFCLFAEDIGYLPPETFTRQIQRIKNGEDNSANILSVLFKMMDEKDPDRKIGRFENVRWFNGPLFQIKPEIVMNVREADMLAEACKQNWKNVRPEIFGALFESAMAKKARHRDGMHFTSENDILKIIRPCIVDPLLSDFSNCETHKDFLELHKRLKTYRVLDPACGSGNFLVVAYREIKRIEERIFQKVKSLSGQSYNEVQSALGWYPVTNMYGFEVNRFPALLTRVSLWISKKIVKNEFRLTEPDLPLEELKHIVCADALEVKWDDVDVVVGNPPFIGSKQLKEARGDKYVESLHERFPEHNKMSDYCTYWYEKVQEDVRQGVRVGLVSTNTVSQTNSREASLDKVIQNGGTIFNAVSSEKWSGEAKVHVSLVNFVNRAEYTGKRILDGVEVPVISSRLLPFQLDWEPVALRENANRAFQGVTALGKGFILSEDKAIELLSSDPRHKEVIKNFFSAKDITDLPEHRASEWIIDFQDWSLERAAEYPEVLETLKTQIAELSKKNKAKKKTRTAQTGNWWKFWRPRMEMRRATANLSKYLLISRHTKHPLFILADTKKSIPEDSVVAIAFEDFGHFGVLSSAFHSSWAYYQGSTLKGDLRYTNETIFETFPFPAKILPDVGAIMMDIEAYRKTTCKKLKVGLTDLYNQMHDGGHDQLRKLHQKLDQTVAASYGFPKSRLSSKEAVIRFLAELNRGRSQGEAETATVAAHVIAIEKAREIAGKTKRSVRKRG